ncbi:MAG: hypothetical protein JXA21_21325 [Anaerolineae bacterium]|nr:hypothetical protein [Anaerolineae bacterium]
MSNLTYSEAVLLFKQWGFRIQPGPRAGEVTLLLKTAESCTYSVQEPYMLPKMAEIALAVRWLNGAAQETQQPDRKS